jgi:hypothetical protein
MIGVQDEGGRRGERRGDVIRDGRCGWMECDDGPEVAWRARRGCGTVREGVEADVGLVKRPDRTLPCR